MRIISLAPSNTEILYALGVQDQVIAVTKFCDWPLAVNEKQKIGAWINTEPEKIVDLQPDIILTSYFIPEPLREWPGPGKLVHVAPTTLWDVFESIRTIGQVVGASGKAESVIDGMKSALDALRKREPVRRPRVYMEEWFEPPMASGNWVPELVAIAGGEEVIAESGQPSKEFMFAALAVADPDFIVAHWCGWGERTDRKRLLERPGWHELTAIKKGNIAFIHDSLLNRPGPRLVEGAALLQRLLAQV